LERIQHAPLLDQPLVVAGALTVVARALDSLMVKLKPSVPSAAIPLAVAE
jgi:hypothetical protein